MCVEIFIRVVCVFIKRILTRQCKMQNNFHNWFHLPPHLGFIQPACAPLQPFMQQPISRTLIETQQAEERLTKYLLKAHHKQENSAR